MKKYLTYLLILITGSKLIAQTPIGALTYGTVNNPKFIVFDERLPRSSNAQSILQANLQLNTDAQYVLTQQITDKVGRRHERYQQQYKGLRVNTGTYVVHYNLDGTIGAINGNYYPVDQFDVTPNISTAEALNVALLTVGAKEYAWQNPQMEQWLRTTQKDSAATFYPNAELVVYPIKDSLDSTNYHLAYQINVVSSQPFNSTMLIIDVKTGNILNQYTTFSSAFGDACSRYSGTVAIETTLNSTTNNYELHDQSNGRNIVTKNVKFPFTIINNNQVEDVVDPNDIISPNDWTCAEWGNGVDNVALDAHWAAEMTYDYFKQEHNRDSYDGQGSVLDVFVHFRAFAGGVTAEWLATSQPGLNVFGIALGDGDGTTWGPLVSLDIVAHEFGHGVTQFSSNLAPSAGSFAFKQEAAAINEGISDIWGAVVEDWVLKNNFNGVGDSDKDIWLAGEEVRLNVKAERSLRDPKAVYDQLSIPIGNPMADTYNGVNFNGVRGMSGVISHWFYLLSDGSGSTDEVNDNGTIFNFSGIGIDKAADIFYLAQTIYFTELTNYKDARQATLQAAKDLYGSCSLEAQTVSLAWDAVGVPVINNFSSVLACGTIDGNGNTTGVYDGSGFANIVIARPGDGGIIYSGNYVCPNTVTAQSGSHVVFKASDKIILEEGFKAELGSNLKAYIFNCNGVGNYRLDNNSNSTNTKQLITMNTKNNLLIYPNPNNGQFTIELGNVEKTSIIEVYDVMGNKIIDESVTNKKQINLATYTKGIYLVKVINGGDVLTEKIIYQ